MATIADGRTIPFDWYSDPAVLRLERERIFRRTWQYAGRADQVAEPGAFFTCDLAGIPIVVVRDDQGGLRAFLNVCRHRGSLVCEGEGKRASLQCPYHAWTYGLDGSLRAAPRSELVPGFDKESLGLVSAAVDSWGPFVFVNPDADAEPLADTLGELPALVAASGVDLGSLRFLKRASGDEYAANWKVCSENFLECYHCQVAHPGFSKVVDVSVDAYVLEESRMFSTQYGPVREAWKGDFDPRGPIERGQFHFLWPNLTLNMMPGQPNLSIGPIVPTGPETTTRFLDYFVGPRRRAGVGRGDARVRRPGRRRGPRPRRARAEGSARRRRRARAADGRLGAADRALPEPPARRARLTVPERAAVNIW